MQAPRWLTARGAWLAMFVLLVVPAPVLAQSGPLEGLGEYIEGAREEWEIPGMAIAVVKDGEVAYAEGFGVRNLQTGEPVDENTIFAIGSASKAFTAAAIADLVDEGKIDWDDPVTKYLPGYQTSVPYVTRELTVRDLLTHRSGVMRGDLLWIDSDLTREEILERVLYQEPTSSFRSEFGYNNIMYLAAGQIVEVVTGRTWDEYVIDEFFGPLNMPRSTTSTLDLEGQENVAQPHQELDDEMVPIPWLNIDNIAPAGSINSSVLEMTNWLKFQLNHGKFGGVELIGEEIVEEMHTPQTIMRIEGGWETMAPESDFMAYGMGWVLNDYRGRKVVQHGGNVDGMHALVAMLPEEDLGLVILTNQNANVLTYGLMYRVFDAYLGGEQTDWSEVMLEDYTERLEEAEERQEEMEEARVMGTQPSLDLAGYVGTYKNDFYGEMEVLLENGQLVLRRGPTYVGDMEHWHFDTFRVNWRTAKRGESFATFHLDAAGEAAELVVEGFGEYDRVEEEEAEPAGAGVAR